MTEVTVFVYSAGKLAAEYSTAPPEQNPTTKWTVTDQLGSPRVLVDSLGQVVSRRDFMPFGEEITPDGTHRKADLKYNFGDNIRQKFTGYQKDEETQLDFAEARMYQNLHGRFTAVDPLLASGKSANPQTFNRYVYVLNNPLMFVDPDGLQTATAGGKVFRRGRNFAIFKNDKPAAGYRPVTGTINTRTTINGVEHHWQIRPNGWTVGDRVDGAKFERTPAPVESQPRSDISVVSAAAVNGVKDGVIGIGKGLVNAIPSTWNGATGLAFMSPAGLLTTGGANPFAVPLPLPYSNSLQSSYGSASGAGAFTGGGLAFGTIFSGASMPSVVPQATSISNPVPATLARVIPGEGPFNTLGRPGASDVFVTAADDIAGLNASQLSGRLGIEPSRSFTVIEFPTPSAGIASPINRSNAFFVGGGRTSGGAREFVLPNGPVPCNATIRLVC